MVSEIAEIIPNRFVSIRHFGLLKANVEITEGSEVEKWINGLENYTFEEINGTTTVSVDLWVEIHMSLDINMDYNQDNQPIRI